MLRSTGGHIKGGFERNETETEEPLNLRTFIKYGRPEILNPYLILKITFLRYGGEFNIGPVTRQCYSNMAVDVES